MGYTIKKITKLFDNDNWFDTNIIVGNVDQTDHENAYQLFLNTRIGGSENISDKKQHT